MVTLEELYKEHHAQGLEIIGVSVDPKKRLKEVLQRVSKVSYPNAMLVDATVSNFPEVNSLPTTYIFDRNGVMRVVKGNADRKYFESVLGN